MSDSQTFLPLKVSNQDNTRIESITGEYTADTYSGKMAEFLVKAANCHADLLEALRGILIADDDDYEKGSNMDKAFKACRAAIAKATGEACVG